MQSCQGSREKIDNGLSALEKHFSEKIRNKTVPTTRTLHHTAQQRGHVNKTMNEFVLFLDGLSSLAHHQAEDGIVVKSILHMTYCCQARSGTNLDSGASKRGNSVPAGVVLVHPLSEHGRGNDTSVP